MPTAPSCRTPTRCRVAWTGPESSLTPAERIGKDRDHDPKAPKRFYRFSSRWINRLNAKLRSLFRPVPVEVAMLTPALALQVTN